MDSHRQIVVPAARGTRLHSHTDGTTKTLLDMDERSILERIEAFVDHGDVGERDGAAFGWPLDGTNVGFAGTEGLWPEIDIHGDSDHHLGQ